MTVPSVHALGSGTRLRRHTCTIPWIYAQHRTNKHDAATPAHVTKIISHWRSEPEEGIGHVRHRRVCSFDYLKCLSIEEGKRSLRVTHLLSLITFLRLGNREKIFVRVRSLGHEFVRTRNSMFVSLLLQSAKGIKIASVNSKTHHCIREGIVCRVFTRKQVFSLHYGHC